MAECRRGRWPHYGLNRNLTGGSSMLRATLSIFLYITHAACSVKRGVEMFPYFKVEVHY